MRLLGIDLGTGSVKLVTLDADGVERAVASQPYALSSPQPGWAEIAPDVWWQALVRAAARLPAGERAQVTAVSVTSGVGMTLSFGLAERTIDSLVACPLPSPPASPAPLLKGTS